MECIYILLTFGITAHQLPIKPGDDTINPPNRVRTKAWFQWLEVRRSVESSRLFDERPKKKARHHPKRSFATLSTASFESGDNHMHIEPTEYDVLLGRGKSSQNHTGNIHFRQLVESKRDEYEKASIMEKTIIADRIVNSVHNVAGRFLKHNGDLWEEVEFEIARDKVAHAFRDRRRKHKRLQQNNSEQA
jgi:hypothetical protein